MSFLSVIIGKFFERSNFVLFWYFFTEHFQETQLRCFLDLTFIDSMLLCFLLTLKIVIIRDVIYVEIKCYGEN